MRLMFLHVMDVGVWEKFKEHGKKYNITPYGTETMHVLRAEKPIYNR